MIKPYYISSLFLLFFIPALFWPHDGSSDLIVLKDGTQEESDRVWESEAYVHFILKGTKTVEVRFAKEFVDHIERASDKKKRSVAPVEIKPEAFSTTAPDRDVLHQKKADLEKDEEKSSQSFFNKKIVEGNKGISFYEPRRPYRYWANKHARYKTLQEALSELARIYDRPVEWVQQNMGDENDLGQIHDHLMRQWSLEEQTQVSDTEMAAQKAPPHNSSDTSEKKDPTKSNRNQKRAKEIVNFEMTHHASSDGPHFYDPRRKKKYWVSSSERFDTLNEALDALAHSYQVSVGWIEEHMGESNLIEDIHQNIRRSLSAD